MASRIIGKLIETGELSDKAKNISFGDGILYDYNQDAYIKLMDAIEKNGKACAVRATGTGKMYLAIKWLNDNPSEPFIYIAPTNVILNKFVDKIIDVYFTKQQADKIKSLALKDEINYLQQNLGLNLKLYTYAKIHRMSTEELKQVNASRIVMDEFHRCGADKWGKSVEQFLQLNSQAQVMGLSATPIRPSDGKNMVEEMFDGKIATELSLKDALEQNILPLPKMVNAMYSFEDEIVTLESQLANKRYDPEKQKAIDKKLNEVKQLIGQSGGVREIFREHIEELTRNKGKQNIKMVVFCKDIADRNRKMDECQMWFDRGTKIKKYSITSKESQKTVKISSDDDLEYEESAKSKKLAQKVIETFENDNSKGIKLLFAVDMLNEGLHVKNLDGVIMLRDTSSNIVFLQQLGRALSVDKNRKSQPLIFDLVNNIEVLGEDIDEFRELIHSVTQKGERKEHTLHQHDFEIQGQIIDIVQYLKEIAYTFEDRIAPLIAYYKEFGTIANILFNTKYNYNGKIYNIGNLIGSLRSEYNNHKLNPTQIDLLENIGMIWQKKGLNQDNIRFCIKKFVQNYLIFVEKYHKHPQAKGSIEGENALYSQWLKYTNPNNLQIEEEKQYLINNGIELKNEIHIRPCIKEFVKKYLTFVKKYKHPQAKGSIEGENALYLQWYIYTNPNNLQNEEEKKYLISNGIEVRNENYIRSCIKNFVKKYLTFVEKYGKHPQRKETIEGENALYLQWLKYTNPNNLQNEEEKKYLINNGIELKNETHIRPCIKNFVKKYLTFVKKYGKHPQVKGRIEGENALYSQWLKYTNPNNLQNEAENKYLISNGIQLRVIPDNSTNPLSSN